MNFSLLIPTYDRPVYVDKVLAEINRTTKDKKQIEILFACDRDDKTSSDNVNKNIEKFKDILTIRLFIRYPRTSFLNRDYYNWLAEKAQGDFLWILGDDVTFYVNAWDEFILNRLNEYFAIRKDRIVCASIKDNTPKPSPNLPKFPCFPMFSKETFRVMGFLLHPKIPTWGADFIAYQTFKPIDRLLEIWDKVFLNHVSYHTRQVKEDKTNLRVGSIFNQMKNIPLHNIQRIEREELPAIRKNLLDYIRTHQNG